MSKSEILIFGAGGHAKVAAEIFLESGGSVSAFVSKSPGQVNHWGLPVIGEADALHKLSSSERYKAFVAIGDNNTRVKVGVNLEKLGVNICNAISPVARISKSVAMGHGVMIGHGAIVNTDASIGDFVIVNSASVVEHDCKLAKGCSLGPNACISGNVSVGMRSFLGSGCAVIPDICIGDDVVVGSGSTVIRSLPAQGTYVGSPAKLT